MVGWRGAQRQYVKVVILLRRIPRRSTPLYSSAASDVYTGQVVAHALVVGREPTGCNGRDRVADRVEPGHAAQPEGHGADRVEADVDQPERL